MSEADLPKYEEVLRRISDYFAPGTISTMSEELPRCKLCGRKPVEDNDFVWCDNILCKMADGIAF